MTTEEKTKLEVHLSDMCYRNLFARYKSGEFKFEIGASDWPEGWYADPYWNISVPLALNLAHVLGANDFKLSYNQRTDFHFIEFTLNGETYIVRWYKTFILHRKSDRKSVDFGFHRHNIAGWLNSKQAKTWHVTYDGSDPFNEK